MLMMMMMKVVMVMTVHRKRMKMMVTKIVWVIKLMLNIYNICLDDGVSDCVMLQEGPPVAEMMTVMGKDNTLRRLQHSAKLLQSPS